MPHQKSAWDSPATLAAKIKARENGIQAANPTQAQNNEIRNSAIKYALLADRFKEKGNYRDTVINYYKSITELDKISKKNDKDKKLITYYKKFITHYTELLINPWIKTAMDHNKNYDTNKLSSIENEIITKIKILDLLKEIMSVEHARIIDIMDDISNLYELQVFQSPDSLTKYDCYINAIGYTLEAASIGINHGTSEIQLCYFLNRVFNLRNALKETLNIPQLELPKEYLNRTKLLHEKIIQLKNNSVPTHHLSPHP